MTERPFAVNDFPAIRTAIALLKAQAVPRCQNYPGSTKDSRQCLRSVTPCPMECPLNSYWVGPDKADA